jgi:alpha-tubulin suppressor-like RCC1 family protein
MNNSTKLKKISIVISFFLLPVFSFSQTAAGGSYHTLSICGDSTVMAWGRNNFGQLGNGTNTGSNIPVKVSSLAGIIAVSGGWDHSLALKSDSTVWAWGNNMYGQLGDASNTARKTAVKVSGLKNIVAIASGVYHSLALKDDGTVWAWGRCDCRRMGALSCS